jgi:hypothetical protein
MEKSLRRTFSMAVILIVLLLLIADVSLGSPAPPGGSPIPAAPGAVTLTQAADRTVIKTGMPILFTISLKAPSGFVHENPKPSAEGLEILEELPPSTLRDQDGVTTMFRYKATFFEPGVKRKVKWSLIGRDGQRKSKTVPTQALEITVERTVAEGTTPDIKDIKPPQEVSLPWYYYAGAAAALLLIALGAYLTVRRLGRKRRGPELPATARPPLEVALERLRSLEARRLIEQGQIKTLYSELSEIVREFLEHRFAVPALERTTSEIQWELRNLSISSEQRAAVRSLLDYGDLVKFAKLVPDEERSVRDLNSARDILTGLDGTVSAEQETAAGR